MNSRTRRVGRAAGNPSARAVVLAILAWQVVPAGACFAQDDWTAGNGNWSTPGNWSAGVPGDGVAADIIDSDGVSHTVNYDYTGPAVDLSGLTIDLTGGSGSATNTLSMSSGNLNADYDEGYEIVGYSGAGTFTQTGGTNTSDNSSNDSGGLFLGYFSSASGTYNLGGSGSLNMNAETVGVFGNGNFTQTGGTNNANILILGGDESNSVGGNGTYTLSNGSLTTNLLEVGYFGTGNYSQSGGTNTIGGTSSLNLYLGYQSGSSGTYTLSGSGSLNVGGVGTGAYGNEVVGYYGTGNFNQSGGTNSAIFLDLGGQPGGTGTYTLTGGYLSMDVELIGQNNNVEFFSGDNAAYTVSNGGGTGNFNQSGGANYVGVNLFVDGKSGSSGTYTLSGTGTLSAFSEDVGYYGTGYFNQSGGTNTATGPYSPGLEIGIYAGSSGTYTLSGGTLSAYSICVGGDGIGPGGQGIFSVSGTGSATVTGTLQVFNTAGSVLNLSGGTINTGSLDLSGNPALLNWTGGTLDLTNSSVIIDNSANDWNGFSSLTLNSGMALLVGGNEIVGSTGAGSFTVAGGANYAGNGLSVGYGNGSNGSYTLSYGSLGSNGSEVIGGFGIGTFNQYGGTNSPLSGALSIAAYSGSSGTYTLSGGTLLSASAIYVGGYADGPGGAGTLTVSGGGTIAYAGPITVYNTPGSSFNVYGGSVSAASLNLMGTYTHTAGSATYGHITGGGQMNVSGGQIILTDDTTGNLASVNVSGPATLGFDVGTSSSSQITADTATFDATPTIALTLSGSPAAGTVFTLLSATNFYDNGYLGSLSSQAVTIGRDTLTPSFAGGNGAAGAIIVTVSGGPANLSWIGYNNINYDGGGAWDTQNTQNWENHSNEALTPDVFYAGDNVIFDDTAANFVVDLDSGDVMPGSVTFNNTFNAYTVNGFSAIAGPGNVTFSGSNTVTLNNYNSYTGTTTISGGGLVTVNGSLASPTINITNGTLQLGADYVLNAAPVVNLGNGVTTGVLDLNGTNTNAVGGLSGGAGNVVTNTSFSPATLIFTGGTSKFAGTIQDGPYGGTVALDITSGCLTLAGINTYSGSTTVDGGKLIVANSAALGSSGLTINNSATAMLAPALGAPVQLPFLNITSPTATLDVTNNTLLINYIGSSPASLLASQIASAYDQGLWDGPGITSSLAATTPGTALGYIDTGSQVIIMYTWLGDTDLNGTVNYADLQNMAPTGTTNATWSEGDFNYDGIINQDDYSLFLLGAAESGGTNISTTLPEPAFLLTTIGMLLASASFPRRRYSPIA